MIADFPGDMYAEPTSCMCGRIFELELGWAVPNKPKWIECPQCHIERVDDQERRFAAGLDEDDDDSDV